ncbi:hypothetical protein Tco_0827483 [Tanacetum coccineum]
MSHDRNGASAKAKTVNGERQIQSLVDKKKVIITEKSMRIDLTLEDAEGTECLPNDVIFKQFILMSAKTIAWNEFSSTMAFAIICLATNQNFNFSKCIFDNMMKNLKGGVKFLMYPRKQRKDSGPTEPIPYKATNEEPISTPSCDPPQSDGKEKEVKNFRALEVKEERYDEEMLFDVQDDLQGEEVVAKKEVAEKEVSAADPVTTADEVVTTASNLIFFSNSVFKFCLL